MRVIGLGRHLAVAEESSAFEGSPCSDPWPIDSEPLRESTYGRDARVHTARQTRA